MNSMRFALLRFLVWLIGLLSTHKADPADLAFCYRLLLDRSPDAPGWRQHMQLIRPGVARGTLVEGFLNSTEFQTRRGRSTVQMVDTGRFLMAVDSEDPHIAPGILGGIGYEPHVTAALTRELRPDSVFVDLGANMGWFVLTAAAIARQGQIIAIEPNYNNVQLLYRSLLANQYDNVRVLPYAVSDRPVRLRLNYFRSNGYVSPVEDENGTTAIVEGLPLDAMLVGIERIDVLKIDIEGYEPVALRGMAETLRRCQPLLLCEFHPAMIRANSGTEPAAFLHALAGFGYDLRVLRGDGSETANLDPPGIMAEWERLNRERNSDGQLHLDLIGRVPQC